MKGIASQRAKVQAALEFQKVVLQLRTVTGIDQPTAEKALVIATKLGMSWEFLLEYCLRGGELPAVDAWASF